MTFPSVTLCMYRFDSGISTTYELNDEVLILCKYGPSHYCKVSDFVNYSIWYEISNTDKLEMNCYKFNSGKNAIGQQSRILNSTRVGEGSGLTIILNITLESIVHYHISDNAAQSAVAELSHVLQPRTYNVMRIKKSIDEKLGPPYNPCIKKDSEKSFQSYILKEMVEKNVTYRQVNCYDLCYRKFIQALAIAKNISELEARYLNVRFDLKAKCNHLCPYECRTVHFDWSENRQEINVQLLNYLEQVFLNKSTVYRKENLLTALFEYESLKYTQISQIPKMTFVDLVSNTGGVLGVFLELSFFSVYRMLYFLIEKF